MIGCLLVKKKIGREWLKMWTVGLSANTAGQVVRSTLSICFGVRGSDFPLSGVSICKFAC
jgi:hypothetical protein